MSTNVKRNLKHGCLKYLTALLMCWHMSALHSAPEESSQQQVWMTVFIHGAIKAEWARYSLFNVMCGTVEDSIYSKAVTNVRNDSFFYRLHAIQNIGLKKINMEKKTWCGACATAHAYEQITALNQPRDDTNYYYTFGWSGLCSRSIRYHDGQMLYDSLCKEVQLLQQKHNVTPHIRLICYSHGGNVCLSMAKAYRNKSGQPCLKIDEVIFIGVPILYETDYLVKDPMFGSIYHLYSPDDMIQTSDFFSFKRLFSNRRFHKRGTFSPPSNLTQVSVNVMNYAPRNRSKPVPDKITDNYSRKKIKKCSMNPGHSELWYLGWTPAWYRERFPLYPLPVVVFTSYLINAIKQEPTLTQDVELTIHPQQERMQIRNKRDSFQKAINKPFVPRDSLKAINEQLKPFKPNDEYYKEYKLRAHDALFFARHEKNNAIVCIRNKNQRQCNRVLQPTCLD